jgi:hypothetical protein
MSSFAVTAERLVIHAHPDPEVEQLELAQVGDYRTVVPRGQYKTGDWAIYISSDRGPRLGIKGCP